MGIYLRNVGAITPELKNLLKRRDKAEKEIHHLVFLHQQLMAEIKNTHFYHEETTDFLKINLKSLCLNQQLI